jgi:predicted nucleic acid-binding protein
MKAVVIDASVIASWLFPNQADEKTDALLFKTKAEEISLVAPILLKYEFINITLRNVRHKGLSDAHAKKTLSYFKALNITFDTQNADFDIDPLFSLARKHGLTSYDTTYLDVALRWNIPIATRDSGIAKAAQAAKVKLAF